MRLLNANTIQLEHFLGDVPRYAILSHTWQVEEMQFSDMTKPVEQRKASVGYQKILKCCAQASFDDCAYVWIDTCCINSDSSSELSEAINSMYDWYNKAAFCYVYLADVDLDGQNRLAFEKSRWFTRGWTLQELLAPKQVIFFDCMWRRLGTKESEQWHPKILRATGIEACHLDQPLVCEAFQFMIRNRNLVWQEIVALRIRKLTSGTGCKYCSEDVLGLEKKDNQKGRYCLLHVGPFQCEHATIVWRG